MVYTAIKTPKKRVFFYDGILNEIVLNYCSSYTVFSGSTIADTYIDCYETEAAAFYENWAFLVKSKEIVLSFYSIFTFF